MSDRKDYYEILGVPKNATYAQIRNAYKSMSLKYHPDKNRNRDAIRKYQDVLEAYRVLTDQIVATYENQSMLSRLTIALTRKWYGVFSATTRPYTPFQNARETQEQPSNELLPIFNICCGRCKCEDVHVAVGCGHVFCENCEKHLETSCSVCEAPINSRINIKFD